MNVYIKNNTFWFEVENLTRLFFPNEKISVFKAFSAVQAPYIYTELGDTITVRVKIGDFLRESHAAALASNGENELQTVRLLYRILAEYSGVEQPWGLLTGVRPIKLLRKLDRTVGKEAAKQKFLHDYFVSEEKTALALQTEAHEQRIIEQSHPDSFSLYVGIPFCPSRCSYCSFVMASVERAQKLIAPYVDLLCEELKVTAQIANDCGLRLESVYFGGGTPTTLSAEQLDRVLGTVNRCFDLSRCHEFTVEAGRPDTVTAEKLFALKENNVDRISINPQTLSDSVLCAIGRKHTAEQFLEAFALARRCGFENINTDLIAGLPTDTPESFCRSLDTVLGLNAESITVHTLCMKRAANLTTEGKTLNREEALAARQMVAYARERLTANGYIPYYLYRQTRMVGNLENVGWSKPGCESYYNVYVMDETHTILACGCGGVSKLRDQSSDYLERIFNFKYPYEYIDRFDEMLNRKAQISRFYGKKTVDYSAE